MELFRALYELYIVSQDKHQHREQATALGGEGLMMNAVFLCRSMVLAEYAKEMDRLTGARWPIKFFTRFFGSEV
jgi:hypothetical protein